MGWAVGMAGAGRALAAGDILALVRRLRPANRVTLYRILDLLVPPPRPVPARPALRRPLPRLQPQPLWPLRRSRLPRPPSPPRVGTPPLPRLRRLA